MTLSTGCTAASLFSCTNKSIANNSYFKHKYKDKRSSNLKDEFMKAANPSMQIERISNSIRNNDSTADNQNNHATATMHDNVLIIKLLKRMQK